MALQSWLLGQCLSMHTLLLAHLDLYALHLCNDVEPLVLSFFVGYNEWIMWRADPGRESFPHIEQWSTIAATVLVIFAAMISHSFPGDDKNQGNG